MVNRCHNFGVNGLYTHVLSIGNGEIDFDEFLALMTSTEKHFEAFRSNQK
jgi:Ca2+-binding EF-hand superfamily protein